jgi:hypothetical protein
VFDVTFLRTVEAYTYQLNQKQAKKLGFNEKSLIWNICNDLKIVLDLFFDSINFLCHFGKIVEKRASHEKFAYWISKAY